MSHTENNDSFDQATSGNGTEEGIDTHEGDGGASPAPENELSGDDGDHGDGGGEHVGDQGAQSYIYRDFSHIPDDTSFLDLIQSRAQAPSKKLPAKLQGMLTDPGE